MKRRSRGNTQVEFILVAVQLMLVLFAVLEFCRMALVYNNVANAARVGVRLAIVRGSANVSPVVPSGPGNTIDIENKVKDFAKSGELDANRLLITVNYPDATGNAPGSHVQVTVVYPYDPFTFLPLRVRLGTTTQGVITF